MHLRPHFISKIYLTLTKIPCLGNQHGFFILYVCFVTQQGFLKVRFLRHCRGQRNSRNATPERYHHHDNGFNTARERRRSAANGSLDFNYDFKQTNNGQRNPVGRGSFSDESDGGSLMTGSIDLSAHNYDFIGASGSSDESAPQSTVC